MIDYSTNVFRSMSEGYAILCRRLLERGSDVRPRGQRTKELRYSRITLINPQYGLPTGIGRRLSTKFAAVEALQLIGGFSHPTRTVKANPNMEQFLSRDVGTPYFYGAYGPRTRYELENVIQRLKDDPDSRQAVALVLRPEDIASEQPDVPCTVMLQYFIRNKRLEAVTTMRSNDVWWGLTYDVFQFTQLQLSLAHALEVDAGAYVHLSHSLHLYERDFHKVDQLEVGSSSLALDGIGRPGESWETIRNRAYELFNVKPNSNLTDSESWYLKQMRKVDES